MLRVIIFILFCLFLLPAKATHNRAGEITYQWVSGFSYHVTIKTYTRHGGSVVADRCNLTIYFGDGDSAVCPRINGVSQSCSPPEKDGQNITNSIRYNEYKTTTPHAYPGPGLYKLYMYDPNRNADIVNIPNSVNIPFYIQAYLVISPILGGGNNSPVLTYPPIDNACLYKCFIHNPGAYDPDGDSLSYELGPCLGWNGGNPIPGYYIPQGVTINPVTGDLVWCTPQPAPNPPFNSFPQEYNFAIYIKEWRKFGNQWNLVGWTERDLQVEVKQCSNNPPDILNVQDTCVKAGDVLTFVVTANDPDNDIVTLSASGAPFLLNPQASFPPITGMQPVSQTFSWQTTCNFVRKQPYQVLFKAIDNDPQVPLVDLESVFIRIVAEGPTNLQGTAQCNSINLTWNPSSCNPANNNVKGYRIYVDDFCNPWMPGACETGVPGYTGYSQVGTLNGINNTSFTISNLSHGIVYSIRVVTEFADGALSYASDPVCVQLKKDVPILTHVDITTTSTTAGTLDVRWVKPSAGPNGLDTVQFPGPYKYDLYRGVGFTSATNLVTSFTSPTFSGLNNLIYSDNSLNTDGNPYVYRIDFYSGNTLVCQTRSASSVFLTLTPSDNTLTLNWSYNVPWNNTLTYIWKEIPTSSNNWVKIDSTTTNMYVDGNLVNGATYCYYVETKGQYSDPTLPAPLLNRSQRKCGVPVDLTPPCPPVLSLVSDCEISSNALSWTNPNLSCADDVVAYNIYYAPIEGQDMLLLITLSPATNTTYLHDSLLSIAGCYAVTAVDSFNNQSALSNMICVDNCPIYELPNVFTPNGDGLNDFFIPFPYRFVKDIDLNVYNRWGELVFSTTDPAIMWNGDHQRSKQPLSDGVYFYTCVVNEIRLKGIQQRTLTGFVHLLRNPGGN